MPLLICPLCIGLARQQLTFPGTGDLPFLLRLTENPVSLKLYELGGPGDLVVCMGHLCGMMSKCVSLESGCCCVCTLLVGVPLVEADEIGHVGDLPHLRVRPPLEQCVLCLELDSAQSARATVGPTSAGHDPLEELRSGGGGGEADLPLVLRARKRPSLISGCFEWSSR